MPNQAREFLVQLTDWTQIHEMEDGWPPSKLLTLLSLLEVDGVSPDEALEMALLVLQDSQPDEAADKVLEVVFGGTMRPGIRRNLAHDLSEERPWEDFADLSQQAGIFNAVVLLQRAFPREFDKPDAVSVTISLATASERGNAWLDAPAPDPALLLRILAEGMDDRSVLHRLFGEALKGSSFPEAGSILWRISRLGGSSPAREFAIISSHQWFDPLKNQESWTANVFS